MRTIAITRRLLLVGPLFCSLVVFCQQQQKSLGEIARESRSKNTPRAKIVIDNDNLDARKERPEIPDMTPTGPFNTDEIVGAIRVFREKHSSQETEAAVRSWYEKHDAMLARAIEENNSLRERQKYGYATGVVDQPPDDATHYAEWRTTQAMSASYNQIDMDRSGLRSARLQQTISGVRSGITRFNLRYDWFKVRFANGNGSY